jgi:hypothetical protein
LLLVSVHSTHSQNVKQPWPGFHMLSFPSLLLFITVSLSIAHFYNAYRSANCCAGQTSASVVGSLMMIPLTSSCAWLWSACSCPNTPLLCPEKKSYLTFRLPEYRQVSSWFYFSDRHKRVKKQKSGYRRFVKIQIKTRKHLQIQ